MTPKKLATFRIDPDEWEAFQQWAKRNGTTASALLVEYIEECLDRPPTKPSGIRLEQMVINLIKRIDSIDKRLSLLETLPHVRSEEIVSQPTASSETKQR